MVADMLSSDCGTRIHANRSFISPCEYFASCLHNEKRARGFAQQNLRVPNTTSYDDHAYHLNAAYIKVLSA